MTLLDINIPTGTVISSIIGLILLFLTYLVKKTFTDITDSITENKEDVEKVKLELEAEKLNREVASRAMDNRINDLHLNILNRLDEIKEKFNDFRK